MMAGAPLPQGDGPDVPLPPQRPPEFSAPTPDQRQLQATTAGTPQDQQPQSGPFGMDLSKLGEGLSGGLDRMTSDPLFNLGIGILSNPRNIGQGLAAGLQSARAAKDSDRRNKLAEQAANRKNIHWFMRPDGTLAGVNADDPSQLVVPPGQTPKNTEGKILQPGEGGVPQGFIGVQNPGGSISLHPMPQTQEQKLAGVEAEAAARARGKASVEAGGVAGAPKITEFDKKAMDKADEALALGKTSMGAIKMARELSKGASQNPGSAFFAPGAAVMGADWGVKTENLKNLLTGEGLNNLKAAFGGNPTEGERKVQLELMGAMGQPDAVRQKIFDNYERVLKNRMNFNLAKSRALRDRSYYDPNSEFYKKFNEYITAESEIPGEGAPPPSGEAPPPASGSVQTAIPDSAVSHLKSNPALRDAFDQKYGQGSAARVLGR
jgi:hypothetical protein